MESVEFSHIEEPVPFPKFAGHTLPKEAGRIIATKKNSSPLLFLTDGGVYKLTSSGLKKAKYPAEKFLNDFKPEVAQVLQNVRNKSRQTGSHPSKRDLATVLELMGSLR